MKIVFLGTPDFAVPSLKAVFERYGLAAVITQPDRAKDRKGRLIPGPAAAFARENGLLLHQFERIRNHADEIRKISPDLMITAAYGQILSREILDIPKFGIYNVHASLLPKYRGSSPIQWAIINGEARTGITIMRTAEGVDNGDIIMSEATEIAENETAGQLTDRLKTIGANLLIKAIDDTVSGKVIFTPQNEAEATRCAMLKKSDGLIDFQMPAEKIKNLIRGLNPWPSAFTYYSGALLKLHSCNFDYAHTGLAPGTIVAAEKDGIKISCGVGAVTVTRLQPEGKRIMSAAEFLAGRKLIPGTVLGKLYI